MSARLLTCLVAGTALIGAAATSAAAEGPPTWPAPPGGGAPAVLPDGRVYVADAMHRGLIALNRDGTRRALVRGLGLGAPVAGAGADGRVGVYALRRADERLLRVSDDRTLQVVGGQVPFGRQSILTGVTSDGQPLRSVTLRDGHSIQALNAWGEVLTARDDSYPEMTRHSGLTLHDRNGAVLWSQTGELVHTVAISSDMEGGWRVLTTTGKRQSSLRSLGRDGVERWSVDIAGSPVGLAVAADRTVHVLTRPSWTPIGRLTAVTGMGEVLPSRRVPGRPVGGPVIGRAGVSVTTTNALLTYGHTPNAPLLRTVPIPGINSAPTAGQDDRLYVASDVGTYSVGSSYPAPTGRLVAQVGRFRSAGAPSDCAVQGRCRPAVPLGTTISTRLPRAADVEVALTRRGASRASGRAHLGTLPAGPLKLRVTGRVDRRSTAAVPPLCFADRCTPVGAGHYVITVVIRVPGQRARSIDTPVRVVRG